jgi:acyl-CoA hydrolase
MPGDLNHADALFGGRILAWIDEEVAVFVIGLLGTKSIVTKHIGEITFESPAKNGDVVEFGLVTKSVGHTSITVSCLVRNTRTKKTICFADDIVFVQIKPETGLPIAHGKTIGDIHSMLTE